MGSRGGQPSSVTPTPPPCDSPHVEMRKRRPKLLPTPMVTRVRDGARVPHPTRNAATCVVVAA
eukprot:CAMPEP_0205934230 /NCGR_PEP_ID=MMETSP1325-20131115/35750_1 /ASSEMBLY_ACC=CAM_ASM_000708 /TAXON_ID=236786 /ORGANISM="Florenciella sp., Strain RCC1007" /LENGTH=62 /DNA_ID=CAMNT_0053304185 /DNA_START=78 /DNA_END=263 /DNA_ORIENTATION=+